MNPDYAQGSQDTSIEAFHAVGAGLDAIRKLTFEAIKARPQTSFELAATLKMPFENVQPRCSELLRDGQIQNSGRRGQARSGPSKAIIWEVTA